MHAFVGCVCADGGARSATGCQRRTSAASSRRISSELRTDSAALSRDAAASARRMADSSAGDVAADVISGRPGALAVIPHHAQADEESGAW